MRVQVRGGQLLDGELSRCHRAIAVCLCGLAQLALDRPAGLRDNESGRDKRTRVSFEEDLAALVVRVSFVGGGEDDVRIEDERQAPNSSVSMSSSSRADRPLVERGPGSRSSIPSSGEAFGDASAAKSSGATPRSAAALGDPSGHRLVDLDRQLGHRSPVCGRPVATSRRGGRSCRFVCPRTGMSRLVLSVPRSFRGVGADLTTYPQGEIGLTPCLTC